MREFSSGILGCIICVLALMGTILGGFCLGVESETRDVTNYDYKTDLTGTFTTENAPEYIDYSPAANYIGYSRNSVNYTESITANSYRYIASYPNDTTISESITNTSQYTPTYFSTNPVSTQVVLNVTGGGYNYGTGSSVNNVPYNVVINKIGTSIRATTLYDVISGFSNLGTNLSIQISNSGSHPLLMTGSTPARMDLTTGNSTYWYIYNQTIVGHPTSITWNTSTDAVTAYNGSTVLFSSTSHNTLVYNSYQYNPGGTLTNASVNATFSCTGAGGQITVNNNSSYPTDGYNFVTGNNRQLWVIMKYEGSQYFMGDNRFNTYTGLYYTTRLGFDDTPADTKMSNVFSAFNLSQYTDADISVSYGSHPIIIINNNWTYSHNSGSGWDIDTYYMTYNDNAFPDRFHYNSTNGLITAYKNNSYLWAANANDVQVIWKYRIMTSNYSDYNVSDQSMTASITSATKTTTITSNNALTINTFSQSNSNTQVLIDWNGTLNVGDQRTYNNISYKITDNINSNNIPDITSLEKVLIQMDLQDFDNIDLSITYNTTYPVLFYYGSWNRADIKIGNDTQYVYTATMNENTSMPNRIVINAGTAQLFKDGTILFTGSTSQILVLNKYNVKTNNSISNVTTSITFNGFISSDVESVSLTVNNSSTYPTDGYSFDTSSNQVRIEMKYTGSQYNNMGTDTFNTYTGNYYTTRLSTNPPSVTKLSNIINDMQLQQYESATLNITYGTHPIIFLKGNWSFTHYEYNAGGGIGIVSINMYYTTFGDECFPDKITYDKALEKVYAYKNGVELWGDVASNVQVIWKYDTMNNNVATAVTDQSATFSGLGKLTPAYAYADPSKGVTLKSAFTTWSNAYRNNEINITVTKQNWSNNDLTISAGNSSITVERRSAGGLYVTINKYDGTTETRNMGNWYSAQITINASDGWIAVTPIAGSGNPNFTNKIDLNETTVIWNGWYNGENITTLIFSTNGTSMRWSITDTTVFLNTYGVVMFNPSIDVTEYFPEMENWRLNFFSFALIGDSITINNQTFPVDIATQTITITGENEEITSGTLNNVYVTQENGHTYFSFANSKKTIDLGETVDNTVSFNGLWYFTTGLFDITQGTEQFYNWNIDGSLHATMPQMCLIFIGILIAALIICKALLRFEIGAIDWIILISATVISLIIAGGNL